jgi:DNA-directed RNA polymerase specialized sigma24 family protein
MSKDPPTEEAFRKLLAWLDPDEEQAAQKYNNIQLRLIRIFSANGCSDPEALTIDTFDLVLSRIDWLIENYVGDPLHYFCGIARNKVKEDYRHRKEPKAVPPISPDNQEEDEEKRLYECLDQCLKTMGQLSEQLLIDYYQEQGNEKIINRRRLADHLGITLRALRLRVFHRRADLKTCIEICLQESAANETL